MTEVPDDLPESSEQWDQPPTDDSLVDRGLDDALEEGYSPAERWSPAEKFGNTAREEAEGETLDQRLAQEEPELSTEGDDDYIDDGEVGDERAGRLVDPDEGFGDDVDSELLGSDVGIDGAGASAEEAAVHVVNDATYTDDEG